MGPELEYNSGFKIVFLALRLIVVSAILFGCGSTKLPSARSTEIPLPAPSLDIRPSSTPQLMVQPTFTNVPTSTSVTSLVPPAPVLPVLDFRKFFPTVPPGVGKVYNHIIFYSNISGVYLLYQINLDGSDFIQLSEINDSDVYDMEPAWSTDGRIAFTSDHVDGKWEVFFLYPDRPLPVQLTSWGADSWSLGWSPDGKYLTFVSNVTQDEEIYLISADGGTPVNLTQSPDANDFLPVWSPDGQQIMFVSNREGGINLDIYVMNFDGPELTRLTTSQARDTSPNWSPDGSKIAFVSDRESNFEVYVMGYPEGTETNGGIPIRLTNTAEYEWSPTWSPDGHYIAFTSLRDNNNENYQVYIMAPDGSNQTRVTNDNGDDIIPRWWP